MVEYRFREHMKVIMDYRKSSEPMVNKLGIIAPALNSGALSFLSPFFHTGPSSLVKTSSTFGKDSPGTLRKVAITTTDANFTEEAAEASLTKEAIKELNQNIRTKLKAALGGDMDDKDFAELFITLAGNGFWVMDAALENILKQQQHV